MKLKRLEEISPLAILIGLFLLSLFSFLIVDLLPTIFYRTVDASSYLFFHNFTEIFSIIVSFSIAGVGWYTYDQSRNRHALFLSCAFIAVGLIDLMHTLSYPGMPAIVTPSSNIKSQQLWLAARMVTAMAFLASAFIYPNTQNRMLSRKVLLPAALIVSGVVFIGVIYFPSSLPVTFIEGKGLTPFKIYSEYLIIFLFCLSFAAYGNRFIRTRDKLLVYFLSAFIFCIFSELAFTLYKGAFDTFNVLGHIYKVAAFFVIYMGIFITSVKRPYSALQQEIIERKQAEQALRQSEEKFSKAFHATPDAIEITRISDERLIEVNDVFVRRSGYSRDDIVGHTTLEFNLWANQEDRERYFTTMREQGSVREQESQFRTKSGEIMDGLVSGETFSMGEEKYILTIIRDITRRKHAEDGLRESEARYRGLHESMTDCFIQVAMSGEIVNVNRSYLEMLGYTEEEVKLRYKDITPAKWHEFEQKIVDTQIIARGYSDVYEKEYIKKDGTVFPVELRTYLLRNKDGKPFGMWTIIRDITERKQGEEALKKSETSLKKAQELGKIGNWELDLKTQKLYWSDEVYVLYERDKKLGPPTVEEEAQYYPPEVAEKLREIARLAMETGKEYGYDLTARLPSGRIAFFNTSINPVKDEKGNVIQLLGTIQDITQRKKTEDVNLENLRLEAADKAKSELLANMSHELRTPLNASIGFSELLKQGMAGELNEKQKHYVDNILTSNQFLLTLINDILDLSKIEAGKIELVIDKMSVPVIIKETLSLIKEKAMNHNVLLKTEFDPELEYIEADKQRFKQILFNLLSNAVKFSKDEGGTVTITAKKEGDMVQISVSDTGIGIKEENIGKLFRKFEQLESGISQKYGGTGLGLAITKQLVELHGGKIQAESRYGEGSTFTFLLPIEAKKIEVK